MKQRILALLLAAGLGFFLVKYFLDGGSWASSAFNRHLYNSSGQLASGTVLDRDGDVLSEVVDGQRTYYDNATVRKATLHAVGDLQGNIGTGALNAFADKLTGYSLLNGAFGAQRGNDLYLTIDARYNYTAYEALGGKSGTVAVYNYETGEILCMVSAPSYDPLNVPEDITTNDRYKGAYLNRFLSSTFTPGSVYKTVTLAAALEDIPPPLAGEIAQPGQTVKGEPPKTAVRCTLDGPLPAVLKNRRRRGIYTTRASARGRGPRDKVSRSCYLSSSCFFGAFASSGGCFSFQSSSRDIICSFILAGVTSLPKYFSSSAVEIITPRSSFFCSDKIPSMTSPLSLPSLSSSRSRLAWASEGEACSPSMETAISL